MDHVGELPRCNQCDGTGWNLMKSLVTGEYRFIRCIICRNPMQLPKPQPPTENTHGQA